MFCNRFAFHGIAACALLISTAGSASAQFRFTEPDGSWQEPAVANPPELSTQPLIPLESPAGSELRFGIDPASLAIVDHQVVRYIIVMQSPSARTVVYEGIRCSTGEKKVYARKNGDSQSWDMTQENWQPIAQSASGRYAVKLMQYGLCMGSVPNRSVRDILRDLRSNRGPGQLYGH